MLVRICAISDLEEGEILKAEVEGVGTLAVYTVGGEVYATDDMCTHAEASLSEDGFVEGFKVTCSWHDGAFDIRSGEPMALPCLDKLRTYAVTIQDDEVFVEA